MVRAAARPAGEIASCGAGAAGVTPRVDGVRVELRERAGAAFCVSRRCAASAFYCWESPAEENLGARMRLASFASRARGRRGGVHPEVGDR